MTTPQKQHFQNPAEALAAMREGIASELDRLRGEIASRQDELESVDEGAVPKVEYAARVAAWVDDLAGQFQRSAEYQVSALRLPNPRPRDVELLRVPVRGAVGQSPEAVAEVDVGPLLAFLLGDAIKTKLAAVIEASAYIQGPPSGERDRMRAEIEEELTRLEIQEERLVCQAEELGVHIARRAGVRPEIVLSLNLEVAP